MTNIDSFRGHVFHYFMCDWFEECVHLPFISWPCGRDFMYDLFEDCVYLPFILWPGRRDFLCDWLEDCVHLPFILWPAGRDFLCGIVWDYACSFAAGFGPVPFFFFGMAISFY